MGEEDLLKQYVNSLGLDGQAYEALQQGDLQTLIWNMLSDQISDPLLAAVMQLMLAQNQGMFTERVGSDKARGQNQPQRGRHDAAVISPSDSTQSDIALATLHHVTRMLGACSTCCGEETTCPECHGRGKPGSVPSIASAEEFRDWIGPVLRRMGMRITDPDLNDVPARDSTPSP